MLLQDLTQIHDLDTQISRLHSQLSELYNKRTQLIGQKKAANSPDAIFMAGNSTDYEMLVTAWKNIGITLPSTLDFRKKYHKARQIADSLQKNRPELAGEVYIVAVPPTARLEKAIETPRDNKYAFIKSDLWSASRRYGKWSFLVVLDVKYSLEVIGLQDFVDNKAYMQSNYDGRGLGSRELLACELQGIELVHPNAYALLLNEDIVDGVVMCAGLSSDGAIILDEEDSDCFLGNNYMPIAIKVN